MAITQLVIETDLCYVHSPTKNTFCLMHSSCAICTKITDVTAHENLVRISLGKICRCIKYSLLAARSLRYISKSAVAERFIYPPAWRSRRTAICFCAVLFFFIGRSAGWLVGWLLSLGPKFLDNDSRSSLKGS